MYTLVLVCILARCTSEVWTQDLEDSDNLKQCGNSKEVGKIVPLIINGTEAQFGTFPWHAGLYFRLGIDGNETWDQGCGGSLLTDQFVLTAAHCVYKTQAEDVRVALGKKLRSWYHFNDTEQRRNVSRIIFQMDDFHTQTYYFDIALLRLDSKVEINQFVMPVCTGYLGDSNFLRDKSLIIAGWGQTKNVNSGSSSETLLFTDVSFLPQKDCKRHIPSTFALFDKFCTMKNQQVHSIAQKGDSGGGLTVVYDGLHYIFGIVSIKLNNVNMFTNVTWPNHITWIENTIREYDSEFKWAENKTATYHISRPTRPIGTCELPTQPRFGAYTSLLCVNSDTSAACRNIPGTLVNTTWVLQYACNSGYSLTGESSFSICLNGVWQNPLDCVKLCPPLRSQSLDLKCTFGGNQVFCDRPMKTGTVATQGCKEYYHAAYEAESSQLKCMDGVWDYPLSYCTPDDICKKEGDTLWSCKKLDDCPVAKEGLKNRVIPDTCYVTGKVPYVCCNPGTDAFSVIFGGSTPRPADRKSVQMCKKYADSVFKPAELGVKNDTCALTEPIDVVVPEGSSDSPEVSVNASPQEFPHIAVIGYGDKNHKRPAVRCAGSLISERYVLSAASCSDTPIGKASWVRLGDYNVHSDKDDGTNDSRTVFYDIEERINHPSYVTSGEANEIIYHDIALYKLKQTVEFNEYIRPICLQTDEHFAKIFALTTGWGSVELGGRPSDILQKVNMTIVENKECSDSYKFYGDVTDGLKTDRVVCASLINGRDTCMSVTGSPLQIRLHEPYCMYSLAGVAAFGRACFVKSPGVYNRVSYYLNWIENIVWP